MYARSSWYSDIVYFILYLQCASGLYKRECQYLNLKAMKYCLIDQTLYRIDPRCMFLRCLVKYENDMIIVDLNGGSCGGH